MDVFDIIALGWKVFPCAINARYPAINEWKTLASSSVDQIKLWAKQFPNCGWGIACFPSDLCVIDVDAKNGKLGMSSLTSLELMETGLPPTFTVKTTSGGLHLYFRGHTRNRVNLLPGLDVRGDSGLVVCPGTIIDGRPYEYIGGTLADLPEWLGKFIGAPRTKDTAPGNFYDNPADLHRAVDMLDSTPGPVRGNGGRNHIYRTACRIRDFGISAPMALDLILDNWSGKDDPGWEEEEISGVVKDAYTYANRPAGNASVQETPFSPQKINRGPNDIIPCDELWDNDPPREWIAEGWIPAGATAFTLFAGDGGTGKSLAALQLGVAVATGTPWFGVQTTRRPVLMVTCEDDEAELSRRLSAIKRHDAAASFGATCPFYLMSRSGKDCVLCREDRDGVSPGEFFPVLSNALLGVPNGPKVLILDTVADVFFGNENSRPAVNAFIKTIVGRLARQHDATVIFISHPSKAAGSQWSGSTAWNNGVRNRIFMSWLDPKDQSKYRTIQNAKANYSDTGGKIILSWENGILVPVDEEEVQTLWDDAVLEAITAAAESGHPYLATYQGGARFIGKANIIFSGDKKLPKEKIMSAVDNLLCAKKIHNVSGKSEGNGLFPSNSDPASFFDEKIASEIDEMQETANENS